MVGKGSLGELRLEGLDVLASLHRGGMGEVFLARKHASPSFDRLVALKVIRPELARDEGVRRMFLDEARVLAHLEHPAVVQVQDFGEHNGTPYLVLEYVRGLSLSRLSHRRQAPVSPPVAARMIAEVARGLHCVHEQRDENGRPLGIVHRDISPQNIMISFDGRMKLLDFGIALVAERQAPKTSTGLVKGKITYVAPEQISGLPGDRRTDVFSLCVVLHELLSGKPLFSAQVSPLAAAEERQRPPRPSRFARVPRQLDRIVLQGLKVDPEERFPDARSLAMALETFASRAGGSSLEAFAEADLDAERRRHREWLESLGPKEPSLVSRFPDELFEGEEVRSSQIEGETIEPRPSRFGRAVLAVLGAAAALLATDRALPGGLSSAADALYAVLDRPSVHPSESAAEGPPANGPASAESRAQMDAPARPEGRAAFVQEPAERRSLEAAAPTLSPPADRSNAVPKPAADPDPAPKSRATGAGGRRKAVGTWGRLTLRARSGGWVLVDGQAFGRTPLIGARIRAGRHRVALQRPGDDRPRWSSRVMIHPDRHVEIELD